MNNHDIYALKFSPRVLKQLMLDCDISQQYFADVVDLKRSTINLVVNRDGYFPVTRPDLQQLIEADIKKTPGAMDWLFSRGLNISDIWKPLGKSLRGLNPSGQGRRLSSTMRKKAVVPGDPDLIELSVEVEMLTDEARRHFKLFKNPFIDDVQKDTDLYMSDEHRYIEAAMMDAAQHSGFLAVIGECGSGKSMMRRKVIEKLRRDQDVLVIYPQIVDKGRLTAASLCDAIIMDISDQRPKITLEQKTRQVQQLLLDRSKAGFRACLIIEEAHDLNTQTLKYLKRFYELEDGYKKLLGIILIGQTELKHFFNESTHVEMREVIRRCQVAEIKGLNGNLKEYLSLKFKRVNSGVESIFEAGAIEALSERLTMRDRQDRVISHAYPLIVNNFTARAMNEACGMGETKISKELIMAI